MPLDELYAIQPNSHLELRYPVPRKRRIRFEVTASRPVTTFVLDEEGLEQYKKGSRAVPSYGGFPNRKFHKEKLELPFDGYWYFVIQNEDKQFPAAVTYAVTD